MDWVYLFTAVHGRISRQPFLIACGVLTLVEIAGQWLAYRIQGDRLAILVDLAFTYPEFALSVKRANDRNLPLWLLGIFFATSVMLDLFSVVGWAGTDASPSTLAYAIAIPFTAFGIALLVELGFRKGTVGPNPHGRDPLAGTNRTS